MWPPPALCWYRHQRDESVKIEGRASEAKEPIDLREPTQFHLAVHAMFFRQPKRALDLWVGMQVLRVARVSRVAGVDRAAAAALDEAVRIVGLSVPTLRRRRARLPCPSSMSIAASRSAVPSATVAMPSTHEPAPSKMPERSGGRRGVTDWLGLTLGLTKGPLKQ